LTSNDDTAAASTAAAPKTADEWRRERVRRHTTWREVALSYRETVEGAAMFCCNTCGAAPCVNPTFCGLCRAADRKHAAASTALVASRAAQSTVEALAYACRQGPKALEREANIRRLGELSKTQLKDVFGRVQRFPSDLQYEGRAAVRWSAEQAGLLLDRWNSLHG
jgi:hypothetical protein